MKTKEKTEMQLQSASRMKCVLEQLKDISVYRIIILKLYTYLPTKLLNALVLELAA